MRDSPLLQGTSTRAVADLAALGAIRDYRRGTYLFHQHDEAPSVYFLWKGRVEISSTSVTGHRQLHTTLEPAQFFGELGVLGDMHRTATAVALEDTVVCVIPGEAFVDFLSAHPESSRWLLRALARQIAEHEALVEDLLFLDLKGRVAKRLLGLCTPSLDELPDDGSVVPSVVTHADLAALAGGSRENVTRILSELQRRGLVKRDGRRYVLANVQGLRRLAGL
jgi:CRP/FNR family transcriptional regulator/CRP/FNR family cyclic AMP-dependent transcriptional regulator